MTLFTTTDPLKSKALTVHSRLAEAYSIQAWQPRREAMRELISTILSHRTTSAEEWAAMDRLWQRCGSWEGIRAASVVF